MRARELCKLIGTLAPDTRDRYTERRSHYAGYVDWCRKNRRPVLIIVTGISGIATVRFIDGLIYVGRSKKSVGFYIPIMRYSGSEIAIRWNERFNIHRFEKVRWRLLNHMKDFVTPAVEAHSWKMYRLKRPITGRDAAGQPVMVSILRKRSHYSNEMVFEVDETHLEAEKEDLLTKLAVESVGDETEQALLDRFYMLRSWQYAYWNQLGRINTAISHLLDVARLVPDGDYVARVEKVLRAKINGREYVLAPRGLCKDDTRLWPDPWNPVRIADLDIDDQRDSFQKKWVERHASMGYF